MEPPPSSSPVGDQTIGGRLLFLTWFETAIATILVSARMSTRYWLIKAVGWDDWTIVISLVLSSPNSKRTVTRANLGNSRFPQ